MADQALDGESLFGGRYLADTDHLEFSRRIPDEFPYLRFRARSPQGVHAYAVMIEEFVHRLQFAFTQVGLIYRTCCLVQASIVLRALRFMAAHPQQRISAPWLERTEPEGELGGMLDDLRALAVVKQLLLGHRLRADPEPALARAVPLVNDTAPFDLPRFIVWQPYQYFDARGAPRQAYSTTGVMESHASAYAAVLLRAQSGRKGFPLIEDYVRTNRKVLYRSLEYLGIQDVDGTAWPSLSMHAILRLADAALDGRLIDLVGHIPANDYLLSELPYARYPLAMRRLHEMRELADGGLLDEETAHKVRSIQRYRRLRHRRPPDETLADLTVQATGHGGLGLDTPQARRTHRLFLDRQISTTRLWAIERTAAIPTTELSMFETSAVAEMAEALARHLRGRQLMELDGPLFEPTRHRLIAMCAAADWPVVRYGPDHYEVFLCERVRAAVETQRIMHNRMAVQHLMETVQALLTGRVPGHQMPPPPQVHGVQQVLGAAGLEPEQLFA